MSEMIVKSGASPVASGTGARVDTVSGWRVVSSYGEVEGEVAAARERVVLADVSATGKLLIQGRQIESVLADTLGGSPAAPGELATFEDGWITKLNRYEYYAVLPLNRVEATSKALQSAFDGSHAHVTSLAHGRDALALAGPCATQTLSKLCALDLHAAVFPDRRAQVGSVASVTALIARLDKAGVPYYELHVDRSYGEFLWEVILDAAEEFEGRMVGTEAIGRL